MHSGANTPFVNFSCVRCRFFSFFFSYQIYLYVFIIATFKQLICSFCVLCVPTHFHLFDLSNKNGWKKCVFRCLAMRANIYFAFILSRMRYNFIRWSIIIFCSTPKIDAVSFFFLFFESAVKYFGGNNSSISFRRGMFNGSHEFMNVLKLSNNIDG